MANTMDPWALTVAIYEAACAANVMCAHHGKSDAVWGGKVARPLFVALREACDGLCDVHGAALAERLVSTAGDPLDVASLKALVAELTKG